MAVTLIIILFLLFIIGFVVLYLQLQALQKPQDNSAQRLLQDQLTAIRQELSASSANSFQAIQQQFQQSTNIIREVTTKLAQLDQTNKQVLDFSGKLQSLENILKNPKQRGILGEYFLETLLGNVLQPNQYKMQYKFPNGEIVDAAIFYRDRIIPVDAKFSLEKYNLIMSEQNQAVRDQLEKEFRMDVKNRIDETSKYIRPADGTTEFAFMFIPAEGVYYNLLIYNVGSVNISMQDLIEYAFRKHVIIVSPTSFFAYLETVLQGLKAQQVEENIKDILVRVGELSKHLDHYEEFMNKVGKNLSATVNAYNTAAKEFKKVDKDIYKLTEGSSGGSYEPELIDKPQDE